MAAASADAEAPSRRASETSRYDPKVEGYSSGQQFDTRFDPPKVAEVCLTCECGHSSYGCFIGAMLLAKKHQARCDHGFYNGMINVYDHRGDDMPWWGAPIRHLLPAIAYGSGLRLSRRATQLMEYSIANPIESIVKPEFLRALEWDGVGSYIR